MDDVFEMILELIFEGSFEVMSSRRVPMPLRVISAIILTALMCGLISLLIFEGVSCLHSDELTNGIVPAAVLFAAAAGIFGALIYKVVKYCKNR